MPATKSNILLAQGAALGPAIARAAAVIRGGGTVAVPTETVYGLAARADSDQAVAAIYRAKGRPDFNPLIVHVADLAQAEMLADCNAAARALAGAFWPGPLTLVLPRRDNAGLSAAVCAGLPSVALRCPAHPVMRALIAATGLPLAAPSANRSGAVSPTCAAHVADSLGAAVDLVLDGGASARGIESTIVALRAGGAWSLLRPGPVARDQIATVLGAAHEVVAGSAIEAPGQLASHYAPGKPLRLNALAPTGDEFMIGFGGVAGDVTLSETGDLAEAAARLYACLHAAAGSPRPRAAVAPVPDHDIGEAINDRLRRAAA
jgi:L-threonylcarbamoyladenylate synthase